jgi:hypothetical protein
MTHGTIVTNQSTFELLKDTIIMKNVFQTMQSADNHPESKLDSKPEKTRELTELKPLTYILFSILIAIGVWFAEFIFNLLLGKAFSELSASHPQRFIVTSLYIFSLSIFIAGAIYKIRQSWLMLIVAAIALALFRFLFAAIYFNTIMAGYIVLYTIGETLIMFLVALGFIPLFRVADKRFKFAKLRDIKCDVDDTESKTKYDTGVCCNCGNITKIAKKNSLLDFLPKKEFHFCDNCGVFLRNNPLASVFFGFAEIMLSSCLFVGIAISVDTQHQSSIHNVGLLFALCGVIDGLRRGFSGIKGVVISKEHQRTI